VILRDKRRKSDAEATSPCTLEKELNYLIPVVCLENLLLAPGGCISSEGQSSVDSLLQSIKRALSESRFVLEAEVPRDKAHFGKWILIASYGSITIRITEDKEDIMLDLIPRRLFREGAPEDAWYTSDVVAKALNLKARTAGELLEIVPDAHLQYLFSPTEWKDHTLPALRRSSRK
jgi:hypothetical protein